MASIGPCVVISDREAAIIVVAVYVFEMPMLNVECPVLLATVPKFPWWNMTGSKPTNGCWRCSLHS